MDLRSQTGLFAGHQFYDRDDLSLQVKTGPDYIYEDFSTGDTVAYARRIIKGFCTKTPVLTV